jgi:hypothetical protein
MPFPYACSTDTAPKSGPSLAVVPWAALTRTHPSGVAGS